MPDKNNLPPGHKRFEFRSGNGGLWGGMETRGDPCRNGAFRPRMLVNVDIYDGEIRARPGLTKLFGSALHSASACIRNILTLNVPTPFKLWSVGVGCPGLSASTGFSVSTLDIDQEPEYQRAVYYNTSSSLPSIAKYGDHIYLGVDDALRKLQLIRQPWGTENLSVSGASQDTPLKTFTGYVIRCIQEFDGMLFIGLDAGAGASKIVTYDGVSFRDDKTGIDPPTCFALYRIQNGGDAIVVGTSTGNAIYIRPTGDSPGTWTSIGSVASAEMLSFRDVLYIATGAADLYSWDGSSLAVARSPAGSVALRCLAELNNTLYFGYETATAIIVGKRTSGGTYTDVEKNLTTQFTGASSLRSLAAYRGFLVASGNITASGGRIWVSPGTTTTGTWVQIIPSASNTGNVFRLLAA